MDIFEFELRYLSYAGMRKRFEQNHWSDQDLLDMVEITTEGTLVKKLTETTPEELRELTRATYTEKKKTFIEKHTNIFHGDLTIGSYIERLEYELKVVKEM